MTAEELRQALERFDSNLPQIANAKGIVHGTSEAARGSYLNDAMFLVDASRSWLRLQENNEQTIEKVAKAIWRSDTLDVNEHRWDGLQDWQRNDYRVQAHAAVAAILEEDENER